MSPVYREAAFLAHLIASQGDGARQTRDRRRAENRRKRSPPILQRGIAHEQLGFALLRAFKASFRTSEPHFSRSEAR